MQVRTISPGGSPAVAAAVGLAMAVLLVLNFLFARLHFRGAQTAKRAHAPVATEMKLPSSKAMEGLTLNFDTLAADIVWIWSLVYLGEQRAAQRYPRYLDDYAKTIADLDPYFFPVYRWFSATYLNSVSPPTHEDLERANAFLRRGFEYFPNDYRLFYAAGMNYIGHSWDRSPKERLEEVERTIDLLERASQKAGAPDSLPLTVSWLYQRRRQLQSRLDGKGASDDSDRRLRRRQLEFLTNMYFLGGSEQTRSRIRATLEQLGADKQLIERARSYRDTLERHHARSFPYLPVDLWTTLHTPKR